MLCARVGSNRRHGPMDNKRPLDEMGRGDEDAAV